MRLLALPILLALTGASLSACGSTSSSSSSAAAGPATTATAGPATQTATTPAVRDQGRLGFEGMPLESGPDVGPASSTTAGATVDGITCGATEQLAYHIHAHLAVYLNGTPRTLPAGIGIPGSQVQDSQYGPVAVGGQCIYWLHTHTTDGVIHIESPTQRIYSLGQFFDEWHEPLSGTRVGLARGKVTAYVNGGRWPGSVRNIPLTPHAIIQLDVGRATPAPQRVSFAGTSL